MKGKSMPQQPEAVPSPEKITENSPERPVILKFIERFLTPKDPMPPDDHTNQEYLEPSRCVDGRHDPVSPQGPQMPGGALFPIFISAIVHKKDFDGEGISQGVGALRDRGFPPGVHHGSHKYPEEGKSDCGFADNLIAILDKAGGEESEIKRRMRGVVEELKKLRREDQILDHWLKENKVDLDAMIDKAYDFLREYVPKEPIHIFGEEAIQTARNEDGVAHEDLVGGHGESAAYVNLKRGVTLDTIKLNDEGKQAFNLDLWASVEQSAVFEVSAQDSIAMSLILYMATEMVLVEDKGKPALPVVLNK